MIVSIKNLRLRAVLGVNPEERTAEREILINLRVEYDASAAARSDAIADALDYRAIRDGVVKALNGAEFHLLEALAQHLMDSLVRDPRITRAHLEVDKPGALRWAESVSVSLEWQRPG